jgi:hypothetical protein
VVLAGVLNASDTVSDLSLGDASYYYKSVDYALLPNLLLFDRNDFGY